MNRCILVMSAVAGLLLIVAPVTAQQVRIAPDTLTLSATNALHVRHANHVANEETKARLTDAIAAATPSPTHWKRGALIGSIVGTIGMYGLLFPELPVSGLAITASAFTGIIVGGLPGALIGGQFPRDTVP